jgi:hypothetical protein
VEEHGTEERLGMAKEKEGAKEDSSKAVKVSGLEV